MGRDKRHHTEEEKGPKLQPRECLRRSIHSTRVVRIVVPAPGDARTKTQSLHEHLSHHVAVNKLLSDLAEGALYLYPSLLFVTSSPNKS